MTSSPLTITLRGRGVPVWLAAAKIAVDLSGTDTAIHVFEDGEDTSALYAALPPLAQRIHHGLGMDEALIFTHASAAFALAENVTGLNGAQTGFVRGHSLTLRASNGIAFHQQLKRAGPLTKTLSAFRVASLAALEGRFVHPNANPQSPLSTFDYGYHVDPVAYAALMRHRSEAAGVTRVTTTADMDASDLILDLRPAFQPSPDWRSLDALLPFAAWQARTTSSTTATPSLAMASAGPDGWHMAIPHASGQTLLTFRAHAAEARATTANGYDTSPWRGKTLHLGPAATSLGGLMATPAHLLMTELATFLRLVPARNHDTAIEAAEYNRQLGIAYASAARFAALHHMYQAQTGSSWENARATRCSDTLRHIIQQFEARGHIARPEGELRDNSAWLDTLTGLGIEPQQYDPRVDTLAREDIDRAVSTARDVIGQNVMAMPRHDEYVAQYLKQSRQRSRA